MNISGPGYGGGAVHGSGCAHSWALAAFPIHSLVPTPTGCGGSGAAE
jgi:hypothetical protein